MRNQTQDITALLFPQGDLTDQEMREAKLWDEATQQAYKLVGDSSPIKLLRKTEEVYQKYRGRENK